MPNKKHTKQKDNKSKKTNIKNTKTNTKTNTKKGNNIIGVLFIILVICIIIGFLSISMMKTGDTEGYFNKYLPHLTSSTISKDDKVTGRPTTDTPTDNTVKSQNNNGNSLPSPSDNK